MAEWLPLVALYYKSQLLLLSKAMEWSACSQIQWPLLNLPPRSGMIKQKHENSLALLGRLSLVAERNERKLNRKVKAAHITSNRWSRGSETALATINSGCLSGWLAGA